MQKPVTRLVELPESELDSLDRKLQIASSAVRGCRNASQKINQLPPELLFNIVSGAQMNLPSFLPDLTAYEDHGREWYSLLHVCRHWRGIIARSPTLWSTIDNTLIDLEDENNKKHKNLVAHERYLCRSGAAPLTVYLGIKETKIRIKSLKTLLKHVARFRELHVIADLWEDTSTPIYTLLVDPAPNLFSLTLRTDGKDVTNGILPPIFAGEMPSLKELTLEHFTIWPTTYFHNLTSLSLSDQAFSRPTTLGFLDFLQNSPMLEKLALVRAGPTLSANTDIVPSTDRVVRLPHLREVSLGAWPTTSTVSRFLSYLSLSPEADVYIWGSVFSNPDTDLTALLPADTTNLLNVQGITKWYLTHYSVAQPGDLLYVPFTAIVGSSNALHNYGVFRSSQLLATLPRYPLHNVTSFVLRDSSYQANRFKTSVWVEIFGKLKNLEELRILAYQSTTTTRSVLTALLPVSPKDVKKKSQNDEDENRREDEEGQITAEPSTSNALTGESHRTGEHRNAKDAEISDSPLRGDHSRCEVLCPKLSSLGIEHDPDLASIFITKLVKSRKDHGCPIASLIILVFDPQFGVSAPSPPPHSPRSDHGAHHNQNQNNPNQNGHHNGGGVNLLADDSSSTVSSRDILNEEYNLRSQEDEELLKRHVKEVRFEYKKPLSQDLVPRGWPTDAYRRTCLPYSF
ncbi:hypothetical protein DFJ43DRAFT_69780 [Lentinula guzmanii]|uniref:F-box domain-containing protein n=1 Tax=Lentinula guzmanii TaxID=2804957 RepID=A0AA38MVW5_9AGAR|nr:hypothetical protein DFJ43DRAFT_69780 [Lentinula guzmanii]